MAFSNENSNHFSGSGDASPAPSGNGRVRVAEVVSRLSAFVEGRESPQGPRVERPGQPIGGPRFDQIAAVLSALFVCGLFVDGWAHNHGKVDESFFTPWHAILYSAFLIYGLYLLVNWIRAYQAGYSWRSALPYGYGLSLIGAGIFAVGGVLDLIWHSLFGIEVDVQALLSPTHLILATGMFLLISGPLRAGWQRLQGSRSLSWPAGAPVLVSLTLILAVMMFFTQFAHPLVEPWAANNPGAQPVQGDLYVMRANGAGQTRLTTTQQNAASPSWSPDGVHIAFAAGNSGKSGIYVIQDDGANLKRLTAASTDSAAPAWSPNGRLIAYTVTSNGVSHIMVMNADGSKPHQLTSGDSNDYGPEWSPDGSKIIFESNRSGDFNLYTINATGSGQPVRLTQTSGADDFEPSWSPDGKQIAFTSTRDGTAQIYLMNANGSGQRRITTSSGPNGSSNYGPVWLPSGKQIAFVTTRDGNAEVYTMNANGSHLVNLSHDAGMDDGSGLLSWSRNGRMLAYGAVGHPVIDAEITTALGIASILLQTALLIGILLFAMRRWRLPVGAATLLFTASAVLISFMQDEFKLIPVALLAGIAADALIYLLRPEPDRVRQLRIVAFAVPVIYFFLYFIALALTGGVAWVIHLWFGAPIMAGILGLFASYLIVPPNLGGGKAAYGR